MVYARAFALSGEQPHRFDETTKWENRQFWSEGLVAEFDLAEDAVGSSDRC